LAFGLSRERIVTENDFRTDEEIEALRDAEHFHQEPVVEETRVVFKTVMQGQEMATERKEQRLEKDGSATNITTTIVPVAACGKKISENEIAGFCGVCGKAVCSEHVQSCPGYQGIPCNKLLCPGDANYLQEIDGTSKAYCAEHYDMMVLLDINLHEQPRFPNGETDDK